MRGGIRKRNEGGGEGERLIMYCEGGFNVSEDEKRLMKIHRDVFLEISRSLRLSVKKESLFFKTEGTSLASSLSPFALLA